MRGRRSLVLLLVLGLTGLRALASTSPPDPLWVPGVYDDADYDDVVGAVLDLTGVHDDPPPTLGRPARFVTLVAVTGPGHRSSAPHHSEESRAPPRS